jgi:hypothetical protein
LAVEGVAEEPLNEPDLDPHAGQVLGDAIAEAVHGIRWRLKRANEMH